MPLHPTAASGFEAGAAAYERWRPDYPAAAVELLVDRLRIGPGRRVLDLGAGTGKLTRELAVRGADVVAVEPVAAMRAELRRALPDVEVRAGSAEALPLDDADVDAATAAQSFHWFDAAAALAELHRVLRPSGWFAVVFNGRDLDTPAQAAVDDLLAPYRQDTPSWASHDWADALTATDRFEVVEEVAFPHHQRVDREGLVGRVASISFVARLDDAVRERIFADVRALFDATATVRGNEAGLELHYRTEVRLLRRIDDA